MWSHPISRKHRARSIVRVRNAHPASYSIKGHGPEAALILALQACTARSRFQTGWPWAISSWRCAYAGVRLELEHTEKQRADRPSKISPSANTAKRGAALLDRRKHCAPVFRANSLRCLKSIASDSVPLPGNRWRGNKSVSR